MDLRGKLEKCIDFFHSQVIRLHGVTTTARLVDTLRVNHQGQNTPINDMVLRLEKDTQSKIVRL